MYVTLDQVLLISDRSKARPDDPPIYVRELSGQRVLTFDGSPSKAASDAQRYGVAYVDSSDNLCVVPDVWSDDDALVARVV